MAPTNIASYVLGVLAGTSDAPPEWGKARRYCGLAKASAEVRHVWKHNLKHSLFEILPRPAGDASAKSFTLECFHSYMPHRAGQVENLLTPESVRVKLLNTRFKHSYTPNWERFDFGGMVFRLSAWLAYATWKPKTSFADMSNKKKMIILGMNDPEETFGLNENRVYISQAVSATGQSATFWALAWAAAGCNSTVLTDHVVLGTDYAAKAKDFSGGKAWYGAVEALGILAEYYNQAGHGDMFAIMFFGGLHAVNTVVGHSDEGGLMRDVWRKMKASQCFGGIPRESVRVNSMPSLSMSTSYRALINWVDAYTLLSAAAVAHCDPLCEVGEGVFYPTVLDCMASASGKARITSLGSTLEQSFGCFSRYYIRALTQLVGGEAADCSGRADSIMYSAAAEVFTSGDCRHLDYEVVAPYFWIEPTGLLLKNMFGTPAESEGWASYGAGSEVYRSYFFEKAQRVGTNSDFKSEWVTYFHGARRCGAILFLQGAAANGLGYIAPIQCDTNSLCLTATSSSDAAALQAGTPLNGYLWTRGQSCFPHPAECLNLGRTMMMRVTHYATCQSGVVYSKNVPLACELDRTEVVLTFNRLEQVYEDYPNREPAVLRRARKQATAALNHAAEIMSVASGRPLVDNAILDRAPVFPGSFSRDDITGKETQPEPSANQTVTTNSQPTTELNKRANVVSPTLQHESLRAPQLARSDHRPVGTVVVEGTQTLTQGEQLIATMAGGASPTSLTPAMGAVNLAGEHVTDGAQPAATP